MGVGVRVRERVFAFGRRPALLTLLVAILAVILTISRRPDSIFRAQFWAEDGQVWYAEAYNQGWLRMALTPHTGYFQTVSRLAAALSLPVGLAYAPLVYNVIALALQVLPAILLVTRRMERAIPDVRIRLLLALIYIGVPNSYELDANITNAMTHLALIAALIVFSEPGRHTLWKVHDVFFMLLAGLSGPFMIVLFPLAVIKAALRRQRWGVVLAGIAGVCASVQLLAFLTTGAATRPRPPLGASLHNFISVIAGQVFTANLVGMNHYNDIFNSPSWQHGLPRKVIFALGAAAVLYAFIRGNLELRLMVIFAFGLLCAALATPVISYTQDNWPLLAHPRGGDRYWVIPGLAFDACLVWILCRSRFPPARLAATAAILVLLGFGMLGDWRYTPYVDLHPDHYASVFEEAPRGSFVVIPINPPPWHIDLYKK